MSLAGMPWWELQKLFTDKDREAIHRAIHSYYADIDLDWAETEAGRYELKSIIRRKYHYEEFVAGMQ